MTAWDAGTPTVAFNDKASLQRLRVINGQWEVSDGQLQAIGGKTDDNLTVLLTPCPSPDA